MKLATDKQGVLSRLTKDRRGNFGMMTALLLPVLLGAGGISIDVTKMMMTKNRLQDAADAAALAAASALANDGYSIDNAKLLALRFIETQMRSGGNVDDEGTDNKSPDSDDPSSFASSVVNIEETPTGGTGKAWVINVTASMDMDLNPLTRLLVKDKATITANTSAESATESKNALSMYLVLDKSGSMLAPTKEISKTQASCDEYNNNQQRVYRNKSPCYIKKIEKLKTSAGLLFDYLNGADPSYKAGGNPSSIYVRTGTASYDSAMRTSSNTAWGTNGARTQVNNLQADGGTSSTAAMNAAYTKLTEKGSDGQIKENKTHIGKNGQIPTKYIVFMTDGNNNNSNDDGLTLKICEDAGKAGIIIFSVAFMAPNNGKELLRKCAAFTTGGRFFAVEDGEDLDDAFFEIGQQAAKTIARLTH